jgi:spore coat protein U-like protein
LNHILGATMKIVIPVIALSALIASGVSAWSGSSSTGNLQIKMTIDKACTVNPDGDALLDFGEYGILAADNPIERETSIQVKCTSGVFYSVALNAGLYPERKGVTSTRRLKNSHTKGDYISYQLRSPEAPPGWTGGWGIFRDFDLEPGPDRELAITRASDGNLWSHVVKGSLTLRASDAPPGTYTDTVTITVGF